MGINLKDLGDGPNAPSAAKQASTRTISATAAGWP
jgi:hypothetical protein